MLTGTKQTEMVNKKRIFEICLGKSFEEFIQIEQTNTVAQMLNSAMKSDDSQRVEVIKQVVQGWGGQIPAFERGRYLMVK